MGLEFIVRTIKSFCIVMLIGLPFGIYYADFFRTLSFLSGGVWAIINLLLITSMVQATIRPEGADARRAVIVGLIKFPLLYFSGYLLLSVQQFNPLYLLAGFTALLAILILKAIGRFLQGNGLPHSAKSTPKALS